jgi:hypothetical protein
MWSKNWQVLVFIPSTLFQEPPEWGSMMGETFFGFDLHPFVWMLRVLGEL